MSIPVGNVAKGAKVKELSSKSFTHIREYSFHAIERTCKIRNNGSKGVQKFEKGKLESKDNLVEVWRFTNQTIFQRFSKVEDGEKKIKKLQLANNY